MWLGVIGPLRCPRAALALAGVIMAARTDALVWDCLFGAWVAVNGGAVEIGGMDFTRLTPTGATQLVESVSAAVAEANTWAQRWDPITGTYREDV